MGLFLAAGLREPLEAVQDCVECHQQVSPGMVNQWLQSEHSENEVGCVKCHGEGHTSSNDVARAQMPTERTCGQCHPQQVEQFGHSKHAAAWTVMKTLPSSLMHAMPGLEDTNSCANCHKIGLKSDSELAALRQKGLQTAALSCASCHRAHTFSKQEALQPQSCQPCHTGFVHQRSEKTSNTSEGVRSLLQVNGLVASQAATPSCASCHFNRGEHGAVFSDSYLATRYPLPEDPQWAADCRLILQTLDLLDAQGQPTALLQSAQASHLVRASREELRQQRQRMLPTCQQCHPGAFAQQQLQQSDKKVRDADHTLAEAIRLVCSLYKNGLLSPPPGRTLPRAQLSQDSPSLLEQKLALMFGTHRIEAVGGTFHTSPDPQLWEGWTELGREYGEMKSLAADLRDSHK